MNRKELKHHVGQAAVDYLFAQMPEGAIIGIGTGSTVNCFIDALATHPTLGQRYRSAVSSSHATTVRLSSYGIQVIDLNDLETLPVYVDGADEIDPHGHMIKGGGGALTGEKIIAMAAQQFVCIVDDSKRVSTLGNFALPVEIVPLARAVLSRKLTALGGMPVLRTAPDDAPYFTEHGNQILDVAGLKITEPLWLEAEISHWPGVVTVGLFAKRCADICLCGTEQGVKKIRYRN